MSRRSSRRTVLAEPVELALPSATDGVSFQARITARYRPGRARHETPDSVARAYLISIARPEATIWQADQLHAAKDAINDKLGRPAHCPDGIYQDLVGRVELSLLPGVAEAVAQLRDHQAHVQRLRYLKAALYTNPSLMLIDHLQRHPEDIEDPNLEKYRRLADRLHHHEKWWSDLRAAWDDLAAQTKSTEAAGSAMKVLLDAILRLDRELATRHHLPPNPSST